MRKTGWTLTGLLVVPVMISIFAPGRADTIAETSGPAKRAEELLAEGRAALGGDDLLKSLSGLVARFDVRSVIENRDHRDIWEYRVLLPDKYEEDQQLAPTPAITVLVRSVVNGGDAWMKAQAWSKVGNLHIPDESPAVKRDQEKELRDNFVLLTVAWLLKAPASVPLQFAYAERATASHGRADAIDVRAPDGFSARLFLDARTHVPVMVTYRGMLPRLLILSSKNNDPKTVEELKRRAQTEMPPKVEAEIQMRLKDYRPVSGILFPHTITKTANGKVVEEMAAREVKINPQDLSAASFARQ